MESGNFVDPELNRWAGLWWRGDDDTVPWLSVLPRGGVYGPPRDKLRLGAAGRVVTSQTGS